MADLVPVRVRDCACPHTPHDDGDVVYVHPTLSLEGGVTAEQQMLAHAGEPEILQRLWLRTFLTHGAAGWNLTDEDGDPVPFDLDYIMADWALARPVADRAADLYMGTVTAPFRAAPKAPSPTGPTEPTTFRRPRRTPSSPA